jgi:Ferroportin1 (FPN1)
VDSQPLYRRVFNYTQGVVAPWRDYVAASAFLPSFSLSLLYLTVLSFGAQMVTYLIDAGFTPLEVSYMRIGAVVSELAGTWTAPLAISRIGPVRSGLWFINWQFGCLAIAAVLFVFLESNNRFVALGLIIGVALSRLGLWGFDLSAQYLIQEVSTHCICNRPLPPSSQYSSLSPSRTDIVTPESDPSLREPENNDGIAGALFIHRGSPAEYLRASLLCLYDHLFSAGAIQIPRPDELLRSRCSSNLLCCFHQEGEGPSPPRPRLFQWRETAPPNGCYCSIDTMDTEVLPEIPGRDVYI